MEITGPGGIVQKKPNEGSQTRNGDHPSTRRFRFASMASAYFLGTFNDNFFKQSVLLIAVLAGNTDLQGWGGSVFTLPFVLLAAPAGWLADRFAKRRVVIAAKWMELAAMLFGAVGICTGHWILIFTMLAIMGTQAAIFSPAINGSIPELFPERDVVRVNGILRMLVVAAILSGIGFAGFALNMEGIGPLGIQKGRLLVSMIVISIAVVGVLVSYGVYSRKATAPHARFPWTGPIDTLKVLIHTRHDRLLAVAIAADVFIWFAGSLQIFLLNPLGLDQFKYSTTMTSLLLVSQLGGLGIGGMLSSIFAKGPRWYRVLVPAGLLMSFFMFCIFLTTYLPLGDTPRTIFLFACVGLVGAAGGLFMIPLESFIQVRPSADKKGTTWASANFIIFSGIMVSGPVSNVINAHLLQTTGFGVLGILSLAVSLTLYLVFRKGDLA
jgi:acyl-[acyl-carrier-protein]-phospholipid O-acyltransferase/long-chain-fatty-acid--[acyl-carrier-protein] ligase